MPILEMLILEFEFQDRETRKHLARVHCCGGADGVAAVAKA